MLAPIELFRLVTHLNKIDTQIFTEGVQHVIIFSSVNS